MKQMKQKNLSLVLGFVLSFSMLFINAPLLMGNGMITGASAAPLSGSSIGEVGVVEGDVLYYHYANEWDNSEDHGDEPDRGIVKIVVADINSSEDAIFYDFYRPMREADGPNWFWNLTNDDMGDDAERWLKDDFTNPVFNHSIVFPNNITNMQTENATWDFDAMFMDSFNSTSVITEYSDGTGDWHTLNMTTNPDDGTYAFSILAYINKTTGLMTYYEEINGNDTFTLELAGFEMANFAFETPDSFGVQPGDWIDSFIPEMGDRDGDNPGEDEKWADYPDWLEPNDNIESAFDLHNTGSVPGKWNELNLHATEDYYKFYVGSSIDVEIYVEYFGGADVVLSLIEYPSGNVLQNTLGEQTGPDPMVRESLYLTPANEGWYYIKVNGTNGLYDDKYNFGIKFGEDWGPEYWPQQDEPMNDRDNSLWVREIVEFVYYNPYTEEDVIINSQEIYKFPTMAPEELGWSEFPKVRGRIDPSDPNVAIGDGWFHKDINFESAAFTTWFEGEINSMWDLQSHTLTTGPGWIQVNGIKAGGADPFFFYAEQLSNVGTVRYFNEWTYNSTEDRDFRQLVLVIESSIPGAVIETHAALGVDEGDSWTYLVQEEKSYNEWGPDNNFNDFRESVIMATFTVTHIFALNHTTMGVVGSMEVQIINNDGSIEPESHIDSFYPFLVWDTTNPVSFITMGGHGNLDGPQVLLPAGIDWSTEETAMLDLFTSMDDGPGVPIAYFFDQNTVRFKFDGSYDDSWEQDGGMVNAHREWHHEFLVDVNEFGMTTHLNQRQEERENWHFDDGSGGSWDGSRENREEMVAFMVDGSKGCVYEDDISSVTGVQPLDTFVWEHSRFRPAGEWGPDDMGDDPADKFYDMIVIGDVLSTCDEYVVLLGAQFKKGPEDTVFQPHEWHLNDGEGGDIVGNYWYLGSIRDNDIWTWMNSQIFDIGITDLAGYEADLAEILSYAFAPGAVITAADVTVNGTTFEVIMPEGNIDHVFRFAINDEGIMQDMFMGEFDTSTNTWLNWERTVLIDAPAGYTVGEYYLDGIPENYYPPDDTDDDTPTDDDDTPTDDSPTDDGFDFGNIPGYSTGMMIVLSIFGIAAITLKKRK
ncbi:MAG: hypothetical protein ACTSYI_14465 [Promethearchaeota archaeon]